MALVPWVEGKSVLVTALAPLGATVTLGRRGVLTGVRLDLVGHDATWADVGVVTGPVVTLPTGQAIPLVWNDWTPVALDVEAGDLLVFAFVPDAGWTGSALVTVTALVQRRTHGS